MHFLNTIVKWSVYSSLVAVFLLASGVLSVFAGVEVLTFLVRVSA